MLMYIHSRREQPQRHGKPHAYEHPRRVASTALFVCGLPFFPCVLLFVHFSEALVPCDRPCHRLVLALPNSSFATTIILSSEDKFNLASSIFL
jgi:hypothetical protein